MWIHRYFPSIARTLNRVEHLHIGEIISNYSNFLRSWFWNIFTVLFRWIWASNFYKKKCNFSNNFWPSVVCRSNNVLLHPFQVYVRNWDWNSISFIEKIHFINNSNLKQIDSFNETQNIFCNRVLVCICSCLVDARTSPMETSAHGYMLARNVRALWDQPEWKIKFEISLVQQ